MTYLNWKPVISSLLCHMDQHGLQATIVNDGMEKFNISKLLDPDPSSLSRIHLATDIASGGDTAWITLKEIDNNNQPITDNTLTLFLVYGNDPDEIVCDYAYTNCPIFLARIESALTSFYDEWSDRPCPVSAE